MLRKHLSVTCVTDMAQEWSRKSAVSGIGVKGAKPVPRLGGHAVVIGGSIAGLMAARVLSDFFDQVTVLERDEIEEGPAIHKSVPQGNHFHGLLQGGQEVLSSFFQARALQQVLAECDGEINGLSATFFQKAAEINSGPGTLCTTLDFAFPQTRGERPQGLKEQAQYMAALDRLQADDVKLQRLVTGVFLMTQPLSVLHQEPLRSRVLARSRS